MVSDGVRLFGCLSSTPPLDLSPSLAGGARLSGCLSLLVSLHFSPCVLAVSGSPDVFLLVSFCLPPRLAGGVRPFGCLSLILFVYLLFPIIWLPFWLVVSGSLDVSLHLFPFICLPCCLVVSGCPDVFCVFSLVSHRVPPN